jgi:TetR/AcrR family transcriptional repressor of nem operon
MQQAAQTRDLIIAKAFELMLQRGLNGFSYRDIAEPLGIRNAAIHYHFPNKMDLVRALVEANQQKLRTGTADFMANGGPARPQLEGLFAYTLKQYQSNRPICLVGALAVDYDELPEDVREASNRFMQDSHGWLTRVLKVGREQGEFSFSGEPRSKAMSILATIQGARQLARIHGVVILEALFGQIRLELGIDR